MELKKFVSETIKQVVDGVFEAQSNHVDLNNNAVINPKKNIETIFIEFDVAVTVTEKESGKTSGGGAIEIATLLSVKGGGERATLSNSQIENRIKFKVPVQFSHQKNDNTQRRTSLQNT